MQFLSAIGATPLNRSAVLLAAAIGGVLACSGIRFSPEPLEDATAEEARASGYGVPAEAWQVHAKRFSSLDIACTYLRYRLPGAQLADEIARRRADPTNREHAGWTVPDHWPDYRPFGEEAAQPDWFVPSGAVVFEQTQSAWVPPQDSDMGEGSLTAFDAATGTVHQWTWTWQHWQDRAPEAAVSAP